MTTAPSSPRRTRARLPFPYRGEARGACCAWPRRCARAADSTGRRSARRATPMGAGGARQPGAVLGHGVAAARVPDLQRRGAGADAPGRGAAARARCRDGDRADRRPARPADFDGNGPRRPAQDAGQPVGQRDRAVQALPARRRSAASGLLQAARRADRGRGHGARDAVARAPVRARPHASPRRWAKRPRQRKAQPQLRFSYDMLGEGARTDGRCAALPGVLPERHRRRSPPGARPSAPDGADGISIKLSALFPRYEDAQRERVFAELLPRVWEPDRAGRARQHQPDHRRRGERPARAVARRVRGAGRAHRRSSSRSGAASAWRVQSYQTRALDVVDEVARDRARHGLSSWCGWSRARTGTARSSARRKLGLPGYPVFTHKHHTDIAYLACARR